MKILVIIPTLNEFRSIDILIKKFLSLKINMYLLFVDDQSTDGTQIKIKNFSKKNKRIKYIFKKKDFGIGSALRSGFRYAYNNNYDYCITMDADGTHDVKKIPVFLKLIKLNCFDIISTNRFLLTNSIQKWPLLRIFITKFRYSLVKFLLKSKLDSTGNFRCFNLKKITKSHFFLSKNKSYFFLIESLFYFEKFRYKIKEIPIYLNPRMNDNSKMKISHIVFALCSLIRLRLKNF